MTSPIGPTVKFYNLDEIDETKKQRLLKLKKSFQDKFHVQPDFVVIAPGRVNLIGEHIDTHGFAAIPMALENSIAMVCSIEETPETAIEMANESPEHEHYKTVYSFGRGPKLHEQHHWANYVLSGYHGVMGKYVMDIRPCDTVEFANTYLVKESCILGEADRRLGLVKNTLKLLVDSTLPEAAGLSSSSALLCSSAIATSILIRGPRKQKDRDIKGVKTTIYTDRLASECSSYERLVGTQGGSMDHTVIMTAQKGFAKHIKFKSQIQCTDVRLPEAVTWLIAHSGANCVKAATSGYNSRILETKLGASLIVQAHSCRDVHYGHNITLRDVRDKIYGAIPLDGIIKDLRENVFKNQEVFTFEEIIEKLELKRDYAIRIFKTSEEFIREKQSNQFKLLKRCEHVFEEADRVARFKKICDTTKDVVELGKIMVESHKCLRDKFECSHPNLDRIVELALDNGALGARMTGAGWGGCALILVHENNSQTMIEKLKPISPYTIIANPQEGAHVILLNKT